MRINFKIGKPLQKKDLCLLKHDRMIQVNYVQDDHCYRESSTKKIAVYRKLIQQFVLIYMKFSYCATLFKTEIKNAFLLFFCELNR